MKVEASYASDNIKIKSSHYIGIRSEKSISLITFEKQNKQVNNERLGCELQIFLQHLIHENGVTSEHKLRIEVPKIYKTTNTTFLETMGFNKMGSSSSPNDVYHQIVDDFMKNRQCRNNNVKHTINIKMSPVTFPSSNTKQINRTIKILNVQSHY